LLVKPHCFYPFSAQIPDFLLVDSSQVFLTLQFLLGPSIEAAMARAKSEGAAEPKESCSDFTGWDFTGKTMSKTWLSPILISIDDIGTVDISR